MSFKLVRTDTAEPCKIQLSNGKHLIGRGKLLDCEDKRVSRNHGELEVFGDKVVIKAMHQNPCFVTKKGSTETQILRQDCTLDINNGDKFGLLPDSYWYELLHCVHIDSVEDVQPMTAMSQPNQERNNEDRSSEATESMDGVNNDNNQNETFDKDLQSSPSLLDGQNDEETQQLHSGANIPDDIQSSEDTIPQDPKSPSPKRCHSPKDDSNVTVKKIKTEAEIKQDPDDSQAGPSGDQAGTNSDDNTDNKPQNLTPNPTLRERCMYGANCYRRNPQHKAQYSHPTDADWGPGAQAPCPRGAACAKRDPRHLRDHAHPPAAAHHAPNPAGNKPRKPKHKKRNSSDEEDDDDDDMAAGLIVQGKRVRKTIVRPNDWSGSESEKEEDPFGTDESDEWQPSSDMTDSQLYSQNV